MARADAWFSPVCRINIESAACLRLQDYWMLNDTLWQARESWTTGNHRPSGFDHAIKHGANDLVCHWLKKGRPALNADHLSSGLQLAKQCGNTFAVKLILQKYKIDKKSSFLKDAGQSRRPRHNPSLTGRRHRPAGWLLARKKRFTPSHCGLRRAHCHLRCASQGGG
jgi:hypothetical protein